jgi:hypothetical protein
MGILEEALVKKLLTTTPQHKREVVENVVRSLLNATELQQVTGLPARRGPADGGIDGICQVSTLINGDWIESRAALNIKIRNSAFSREQLGGFILDMDRENISTGIIITAGGLSPDAESEITRKNFGGRIFISHLHLADFLAGTIHWPYLKISGKNISQLVTDNLTLLLDNIITN